MASFVSKLGSKRTTHLKLSRSRSVCKQLRADQTPQFWYFNWVASTLRLIQPMLPLAMSNQPHFVRPMSYDLEFRRHKRLLSGLKFAFCIAWLGTFGAPAAAEEWKAGVASV